MYNLYLGNVTYKQEAFTFSLLFVVISSTRLIYMIIFYKNFPNSPWLVSGVMLFINATLFYSWGKEYLLLYVGLDKIDFDIL